MSGTEIELIALDLDGTLLDHDAGLPPRNAQAIRRARGCGVDTILATGKTRESAVHIIEALDITLPCVFSQGNVIVDAAGRMLREITVEPALAAGVLAYARTHDRPLLVYDRKGLWASGPGAHCEIIHEVYGEPAPRLVDPIPDSEGIYKILIAAGDDGPALRAALEQRFGGSLRIYQAIPEYVELMSPQVTKGEGVAWLLQHLGIDSQALMAAGDGENDIEMLQLAGIGVAVGNASAECKAAADHIVATNDQAGVAEAIERFAINNC